MSENNESTNVADATNPTPDVVAETYLEKLNREYAEIVPGDTTKTARYIVDHPTEYGITWTHGPIQGRLTKKGDLLMLSKTAPRIRVEAKDVLLFVKTFGPAILAKSANGTSIDVDCERVGRNALLLNRSMTDDALKLKMVETCLLGITTRTQSVVLKFVDSAGTPMASAKEAAESSARLARIAVLEEAVSNIEAKGAFMVTCSENDWPLDEARMYLEVMTVDQATKLMTTKYGVPQLEDEDLDEDDAEDENDSTE